MNKKYQQLKGYADLPRKSIEEPLVLNQRSSLRDLSLSFSRNRHTYQIDKFADGNSGEIKANWLATISGIEHDDYDQDMAWHT